MRYIWLSLCLCACGSSFESADNSEANPSDVVPIATHREASSDKSPDARVTQDTTDGAADVRASGDGTVREGGGGTEAGPEAGPTEAGVDAPSDMGDAQGIADATMSDANVRDALADTDGSGEEASKLDSAIAVDSSAADSAVAIDGSVADIAIPDTSVVDTGPADITVLCMTYPNGTIAIPNSSDLNFTNVFTLELWIYVDDLTGGQIIFNKTDSVSEDKLMGFTGNGDNIPTSWFKNSNGTTSGTYYGTFSSINEWEHFAIVSDGTTLNMFISGSLWQTAPIEGTVINSNGVWYIGASNRLGTIHSPVDGCYSEFRFSSTAKYTAPFTPASILSVENDTVALWHINEGSGSIAYDVGPYGLNGSIEGSATWQSRPSRP